MTAVAAPPKVTGLRRPRPLSRLQLPRLGSMRPWPGRATAPPGC